MQVAYDPSKDDVKLLHNLQQPTSSTLIIGMDCNSRYMGSVARSSHFSPCYSYQIDYAKIYSPSCRTLAIAHAKVSPASPLLPPRKNHAASPSAFAYFQPTTRRSPHTIVSAVASIVYLHRVAAIAATDRP